EPQAAATSTIPPRALKSFRRLGRRCPEAAFVVERLGPVTISRLLVSDLLGDTGTGCGWIAPVRAIPGDECPEQTKVAPTARFSRANGGGWRTLRNDGRPAGSSRSPRRVRSARPR